MPSQDTLPRGWESIRSGSGVSSNDPVPQGDWANNGVQLAMFSYTALVHMALTIFAPHAPEVGMPLEYLQELAARELPLTVHDPACIDKLRVLRAADLVAVLVSNDESPAPFARVLSLTDKGRTMLAWGGEAREIL